MGVGQWDEIYTKPLKQIHQDVFGIVDQGFVAKQDEFGDNLMLAVNSLQSCDLQRLKNVPREQWCEILMASDLIQTLGGSIEGQMMMQPDANKIAEYVTPSAWLDFLQDFDQLRTQNPQVSAAQLLALVRHALEVASHDGLIDIMDIFGFKENNLTNLITKALSELLQTCATGTSPLIAETMVHQLKSLLNFGQIYKIFCVVRTAMRLKDLEDFINFAKAYEPACSVLEATLNEIEDTQFMKLEDILQRLQLKTLMKKVPSVQAQYSNIGNHLRALLTSHIPYHHLHDLFKLTMSKSLITAKDASINALENILFQMTSYGACAEWFPAILESFQEGEDPQSWIHRSNSIVMERIFSGSLGMKTLDDIWVELRQLNPDMHSIFKDSMVDQVGKISQGDFKSSIGPDLKNICFWEEKEIRTWASLVKRNQAANDAIVETLSVAKRAFFLFQNYHLTDIQIFAIISSLTKSHNRGLLLQVSTGSGKSTIIGIIAVVLALKGTQVDIHTSSPVLAERDAKEWEKFYKMFGLTCSHNADKGSGYIRGKKVCYKKDIVYGDTPQFQFDALRDEYSGLSTRAGRAYAYAIVDEVDSMLIDDSSKLTRLASTIPGMDLLQPIYHSMWNRLHHIQSQLFAVGLQMFYLEGRLEKREDGIHSYHVPDEYGNLRKIDNLEVFVMQAAPEALEGAKISIVADIEKFVADNLEEYIRILIGDKPCDVANENHKINLPKNLVKYARTQVSNWVNSAMTAVAFQEYVDYIIDDGHIKPVDFRTTGIVQSSHWTHALHELLQIKHGLRVTTETVTTNFLSNIAMFKKYGGALVGLTGTLGSPYSRQALQDVYKVETAIIPELYYKRFLRLRDQICANYAQWLSAVLHSALHESSKSRGVLIICQTIKSSELLAEELRKISHNPAQIKLYVRNGKNQEKQVERIHPGDIIVATNLAGRGTDIKAGEVEKFGGAHVILAFQAESQRVEEQAFGRTSRQGNKGSGQLIVTSTAQTQDLAATRDQQEREKLQSFVQNLWKSIKTKDELFARFCKIYREIREHLRENQVDDNVVNRAMYAGKRAFVVETLTAFEMAALHAVEELWAVFLKRIDDGELALEEALTAYERFEENLRRDNFAVDSFLERTENCFYWIQFGNKFYRRDGKSNDKILEAAKYFERAIKEEPEFAAGAYAGRAFTLLKGQVHAVRFNSHEVKYKEESMEFLMSALKIVYTEIALYKKVQTALQNRSTDYTGSDLLNQLTSKVGLLDDYARNLEEVLSTIKTSLRAVECTGVSICRQATAVLPGNTTEVPFQDFSSYTLAFHGLTPHNSTSDQALSTIDQAMQSDTNMSIGLEIHNQNLKTLVQAISSGATEGNMKLSGITIGDIETLGTIRAKSFVVEFSVMASKVQELVARLRLKKFQASFKDSSIEMPVIFKESRSSEDVKPAELPSSVQQLKIMVSFAETDELKYLADQKLESYRLAITFVGIKLKEVDDKWTILQNFNRNSLMVSNLKPKTAKKIVKHLRKKSLKFVLRLENISLASANDVLNHNENRRQEEIVQHDLKNLSEESSADFPPADDLRELAQRGIDILPRFSKPAEILPITADFGAFWSTQMVVTTVAILTAGLGLFNGLWHHRRGFKHIAKVFWYILKVVWNIVGGVQACWKTIWGSSKAKLCIFTAILYTVYAILDSFASILGSVTAILGLFALILILLR